MQLLGRVSQEQIVFGLAMLLCLGFAVALPGFLTTDNILNLVRSVSILGILGVAMGLVVIGRGIDLSLIALMAVSVAWTLHLIEGGMPLPQALAIGLAFSLFIGAANGWLVAYVEMPAIFATLAMGTLVYGFGRYYLFDLDVAYMPDQARHLLWLGQGTLFGIPVPIFLFAGVCFSAAISSCAMPGRGAICAPSATICSPRASPACRRGRSWSCNTCSHR